MRRTYERLSVRSKQSGQTLIIAILIIGVLLVLGVAFATIINRNVTESGRSARRTVSSDLSKAGAEYAHNQLVNSAEGADWRPQATNLVFDAAGLSKDPDSLYLRPGSGLSVEPDPVNRPGIFVVDRGGPDFLGPYSRIGFGEGRALVRVRFAPNDYEAFVTNTGGLRASGQARNYLIIESVGRAGEIQDSGRIDPSRLLGRSVKVALYTGAPDLLQSLGEMKSADATVTASRKMVAFASIGIIETSQFITNKDKVTRPAEIGIPTGTTPGALWTSRQNIGVQNESQELNLSLLFGQNEAPVVSPRTTGKWDQFPGGASLHANSEVRVHGSLRTVLNRFLGETISATGGFKPANDAASLNVVGFGYDGPTDSWTQNTNLTLAGNALDSGNATFDTLGGSLLDGSETMDQSGYPRDVRRKEPPSISKVDEGTGLSRYMLLTGESNTFNANGDNIAAWGYGQGVYVDNTERGNRPFDKSRAQFDPSKSMPNDWLNPNNANSLGWQGQYYIPVAPYLKLYPDGFEVIRDSRSTKPFWLNPATGASTGSSSIRYYTRKIGTQLFIVDNISNPAFNPLGASNAAFAAAGREFNGVMMFAGDVRVRGVIPTDIQLSVVSMGTIYVEGSITKGNIFFNGSSYVSLTRPSMSMIGLMAKDYVTVNTTMFFGPVPGQQVNPKSGDPLPNTPNPIELDLSASPEVYVQADFLLNPNNNNPSSWTTFAEQYAIPGGLSVSGSLPSNLMMISSADDNGPSFVGIDVRPQSFGGALNVGDYLFPVDFTFGSGATTSTVTYNAAAPYFPGFTNIPVYGLADPALNAYPKFETIEMPIYAPGFAGYTPYNGVSRQIGSTGLTGTYNLAAQDPTYMRVRMNPVGPNATKNFLMSKVALAPFDIRIEAMMFAENGSFFVIPGNWFNANADDTRTAFEQNYTPADGSDDLNLAAIDYGGGANLTLAQQRRYERYGNTPSVPFYAEPLDVKVNIVGAVSQNMPAPMSQQTEWLKKWGWIPRRLGGTGLTIPDQHRPASVSFAGTAAVPNFQIVYDPALATASVPQTAVSTTLVPFRTDNNGNILPPMPRLPVSPTLAYFGDETP